MPNRRQLIFYVFNGEEDQGCKVHIFDQKKISTVRFIIKSGNQLLINWKHLWIYTINQLWFHPFTCWTLSLTARTFKFVLVNKSFFLQSDDSSIVMNMYVGSHWFMGIFFLTRELTNSKEEIAYLKRALKDQVILWLINLMFLNVLSENISLI